MMQAWFPDAKLGIFIHWGVYAVKGIAESWSFYNGWVTHDEYMSQLTDFTAARYDPRGWAELFERAGARYAVLVTKHADGIALWDSAANDLNVVRATPAGRDLVRPFCEALRERGIKVGLYFSHGDWNHPDYPSVYKGGVVPPAQATINPYAYPPHGAPQDLARWRRFLDFHRAQIRELCTRYKPDLLWFDTDWERTAEQWGMADLRRQIHEWAGPDVIINSRMCGHGDYATPEQGVPIAPPAGPWEFCLTMNDSWAFKYAEPYKPAWMLIRLFVDCIGMGGNMLLNCAPNREGVITDEQRARLETLGAWIARHRCAVYDTRAGLPAGHFAGSTTLSASRDKLYLFVLDRPRPGMGVAVKGIRNRVIGARVVGTDTPVAHSFVGGAGWAGIPGVLWVDVPEATHDEFVTVVELRLDGPLDLYVGEGGTVEAN